MLCLPVGLVSAQLDAFQDRLAVVSVLEVIQSPDFRLAEILELEDIGLLAEQSIALANPQRYLALVLLEFAQQSDPQPQQCLQLVQACFRAGRFTDVLEVREHFALRSSDAFGFQLASAYRLGDWQQVMDVAAQLESASLPFELQRLIVRAALELGQLSAVPLLLAALQPTTQQQHRQSELLQLLFALFQGVATPVQACRLLTLTPELEPAELASMVRFWPQLTSLAGLPLDAGPRLDRLQRRCWRRLALPSVLSTAAGQLQRCASTSAGWRIALVMRSATAEALRQWQQLQEQLGRHHSELELIPVFLHGAGANQQALPVCSLDLRLRTPVQRLVALREQGLDVVLDTVGPRDPLWLLTLAQRLAPLQLAWFPVPLALPATSPFDAQLADRWTVPAEPGAEAVPWLALSGVSQLAPASCCHGSVGLPLDPATRSTTALLLVLGAPEQLLPGAAQMLRRCLQETPVIGLWFEHPHWREQGVLERWWSGWLHEELPAQCVPWPLEARSGRWPQPQRLIGVDLCGLSPVEAAFTCLSLAIPIVTMPNAAPSSRGVAAILSALGLESLVREQPEEWLQAVELLAVDPDLYQQISAQLLPQCSQSLLCDVELLARDLVVAITMARSTKNAAL
jgi:hypothetical protein